MATQAVPIGPTAKRTGANIERVRKARGLNQKQLSERLAEVGRPMLSTVVSKIERGERRVDVDDLVALALALNVSPATLLLPPTANDEPVQLTDAYSVSSFTAWAWAEGKRTAMDWEPGGVIDVSDDPSSLYGELEFEREQEFGRRDSEYQALSGPDRRRMASQNAAARLAWNLAGVLEDLATPDLGTPSEVVETWSRMARRRYKALGLELDEIDELIERRRYPGVAYTRAGRFLEVPPPAEVDKSES